MAKRRTSRRKRLYKVFIIEGGCRRFYDDSLAVSKAKAENNARHNFCMEKFGQDVSPQVLLEEGGIRFEVEPERAALPKPKQPSLFTQLLLFPTHTHASR